MSGVANDFCTTCNDFNGNWELVFGEAPGAAIGPPDSSCVWDARVGGSICFGGFPPYRLQGITGSMTDMELVVGVATAIMTFVGNCSDWFGRCLDPITVFDIGVGGPECTNWPVAVVLTGT